MAKSKTTKEEVKKTEAHNNDELKDITIEQKLVALCTLQQIDKEIDKIRVIRGELPLEIQDLEDEVQGLKTRVDNYIDDIENNKKGIEDKKEGIQQAKSLMKKYEEQQMNVRNSREYDSLTKEITFQNLEIELLEKKIEEHKLDLDEKEKEIKEISQNLKERKADLKIKKSELDGIVAETEKEEKELEDKSEEVKKVIEKRLLSAYQRIRNSARNGLAVVQVERDACGGCFSKIPPQVQLDIKAHRKIIVCEYCGRVLVDQELNDNISI